MSDPSIDSLAISLKHAHVIARGSWVAIGGLVAWLLTGHFYTVDAAERTVERYVERTAESVTEIKEQLTAKDEASTQSRVEFRQYHDRLSDKVDQLGRDQRDILMLLLRLERGDVPQD